MIAIASDHAGIELKKEIVVQLQTLGLSYRDYGCFDAQSCDYPQYALAAAQAVASGECERGLLICGTGLGMSYMANKVRGIRCACCSDAYSAALSRAHNNANMLAMGARVVGVGVALEIVKTWLETPFDIKNPRHQARIDMISAYERGLIEQGERT